MHKQEMKELGQYKVTQNEAAVYLMQCLTNTIMSVIEQDQKYYLVLFKSSIPR